MSLPLGDTTLAGLRTAAEQPALADIVEAAALTATTGKEARTQASIAAKSSFAAVLTLLLEAARSDASAADVTLVLEESSWPSSAVSQLTALYSAHKDALRSGSAASASAAAASSVPSLSSLSSTAVPAVVDVSWRVDDYLRSDAIDAVRLPSYLISLTTQQAISSSGGGGGGESTTREVPFACNFQQLQDLLAKLKDAQKQIQQRVE